MKEYWINDNGVDRKLTLEEIKEREEMQAMTPPSQKTEAERIAELESKLKALEILTGQEV